VRHHWAVRTILHASNEENPVVDVMASLVVRPDPVVAAPALLAECAGKLTAPSKIHARARIGAA
jgi:hypothetical protein